MRIFAAEDDGDEAEADFIDQPLLEQGSTSSALPKMKIGLPFSAFSVLNSEMGSLTMRVLQLPPGTPSVLLRLTEAHLDVVASKKKSA